MSVKKESMLFLENLIENDQFWLQLEHKENSRGFQAKKERERETKCAHQII